MSSATGEASHTPEAELVADKVTGRDTGKGLQDSPCWKVAQTLRSGLKQYDISTGLYTRTLRFLVTRATTTSLLAEVSRCLWPSKRPRNGKVMRTTIV